MSDYQNDYLGEAVRQKIKLFTKESYFKCFNYILSEKSRNLPAFKKYSNISFSNELLLKEKENSRNKLQLIKLEKEKNNQSLWHLIMLLISNIPNKKKLEYKTNEFNLNPICYSYITNLCNKKLKLLSSFSIMHKIPLDILVKFYLDLCINQINQKEADNDINNYNSEKSIKIIDFKKISKKSSQPTSLKKQNVQKINNNNNNKEKKQPILVSPPIEYSNSFTRLFIGEIDPSSVRERYLSNIVVKKLKQLHLYSTYQELSNMYLKRLYNKLFKKENKGIVDSDMAEILNKFKCDTKKVENYKRNALSFDNRKNIRDSYIDEEKQNLEKQLERQKHIYMEQTIGKQNIKKRKNYKLLSLSPNIIRNDIRIKFKLKRNNETNMRYKNCSFIITNNSKHPNMSDNFFFNEIRAMSAKHSRKKLKQKISNKIQISNSNIKFNNTRNKYQKIYSLIKSDLKNKNNITKKTNSILMKMKRKYDENNQGILKKRQINLKNFLKNDDFYFSKMN